MTEAEIKTHDYPYDHVIPEENSEYQQLLYEAVCRRDAKPTPRQMASHRCHYERNKSAFLKIAPLKLEEISLDPYIVQYHDVIYDPEIDVITGMAKQRVLDFF